MKDDQTETQVAGTIMRVHGALAGLLWLAAICLPLSAVCIYVFYEDEPLRYTFLATFMLPILAIFSAYFWLLMKDPDRLQSEGLIVKRPRTRRKTDA
jgi:hypothetical protein